MLRSFQAVVLLSLALCLPFSAATAATKQATDAAHNTSDAQAAGVNAQAMNRLVKAALEQSLKTMIKTKKPIYPFALLQYKNGRVDSMTYQPVKDKDGKIKPQPDADQWAAELFVQLRARAKMQSDISIVLLTRMSTVKDKQGKDVLGIWTEVDHREVRPWVVFMPLLKQKDGSVKQGDLIYYATDQPIFAHPAKKSGKKSTH